MNKMERRNKISHKKNVEKISHRKLVLKQPDDYLFEFICRAFIKRNHSS